ncbi:hypothetical protein TRVL_03365 [Trypanosoma vivax]|nr:hypothetical protein TRVL_03365 [Trypanosoma vivax]
MPRPRPGLRKLRRETKTRHPHRSVSAVLVALVRTRPALARAVCALSFLCEYLHPVPVSSSRLPPSLIVTLGCNHGPRPRLVRRACRCRCSALDPPARRPKRSNARRRGYFCVRLFLSLLPLVAFVARLRTLAAQQRCTSELNCSLVAPPPPVLSRSALQPTRATVAQGCFADFTVGRRFRPVLRRLSDCLSSDPHLRF